MIGYKKDLEVGGGVLKETVITHYMKQKSLSPLLAVDSNGELFLKGSL